MSEIQLQHPKKKNHYCFVEVKVGGGEILFDCDFVVFNPETEENNHLEYRAYSLDDFNEWMKKEKWIVLDNLI